MPEEKSDERIFKDKLYAELQRIGKALGNKVRLEILDLLTQRPRSVEGLARLTEQSVANTSQHLQELRKAHLVKFDRQGTFAIYSLADDAVNDLLVDLKRLATQQLLDIDDICQDFFENLGAVEALTLAEFEESVRNGTAHVIDVRPVEEYRAGHFPVALSLPLESLQERLEELPRDKQIVAYCRGPWCAMAAQAVELLRRNGFRAVRVEVGVAEWRAADRDLASESSDGVLTP